MALSVVYTTINGTLLHELRGGVETEYVPDPLGSLVKCKNASGTYTYSAEYWAYGEVQSETGTNPSSWSFVGLRGYFRDSAKQLYVRARHLRTDLARWLSVDPLWPSEPAYGYAHASPALLADPSGLKPPCGGACASLPKDGFGACVALICSMRTAKEMMDEIRKFFDPSSIPDDIKRLIELLEKQGQPKSPDECCKAAAGGGGIIGKICKKVKGPHDSGDCAAHAKTQDSCGRCCDLLFPGFGGTIARLQCHVKCYIYVDPTN